MTKDLAALLAKNHPFAVIGKTPTQVSDAAQGAFLDDKAVLYRKTGGFEALVMIGIAVEPRKKVGVAVRGQDAVTFPGKPLIVDTGVPFQNRMG